MSAKGIDATNLLVVPSVSSDWTVEQVLDAGLLQNNAGNVNVLAVEQYVYGTSFLSLEAHVTY